MWSAHFFFTHIHTGKLSSWSGPTFHVCCFMLARASTKTFVSRIHIRQLSPKNREKIFVSRKIRQQGHSLAEVSLYFCFCVFPVFQFYFGPFIQSYLIVHFESSWFFPFVILLYLLLSHFMYLLFTLFGFLLHFPYLFPCIFRLILSA